MLTIKDGSGKEIMTLDDNGDIVIKDKELEKKMTEKPIKEEEDKE